MAAAGIDVSAPESVWEGLRHDWLVVPDAPADYRDWRALANHRRQMLEAIALKLNRKGQHDRPLLLLAETDPTQFLAGFWAALLAGWNIALTNPHWGQQEWQSVHQLIRPVLIWGAAPPFPDSPPETTSPSFSYVSANPAILVPTGGTAGRIKFAQHTWHSLTVAVSGFREHFAPQGRAC